MKTFLRSFFASFCLIVVSTQRIPVINDGNDNTPISHLQYIASLQLVTTESDFFCAAVFISRRAVLTLASCFYRNDVLLNPDDVRVVAGSEFRFEKELNTFSGVLEEIIIHENFSRSSLENNIAIGLLSIEAYADNIQILNLEDIAVGSPIEGTTCEIYGWSLTTRFLGSPHLLSEEVEIEAKEKCNVPTNKMTSTTLCAGPYFVNGCETDDGSPLVCEKKLSGLIDFRSIDYCSKIITNRLGTYVDLSEFREWIALAVGIAKHSASPVRAVFSSMLILLSGLVINLLS